MPTYDYRCRECGYAWEVLYLRQVQEQPAACPGCGSSRLERLPAVPYVLKHGQRPAGQTCCGREERCDAPPCASGSACRRD